MRRSLLGGLTSGQGFGKNSADIAHHSCHENDQSLTCRCLLYVCIYQSRQNDFGFVFSSKENCSINKNIYKMYNFKY